MTQLGGQGYGKGYLILLLKHIGDVISIELTDKMDWLTWNIPGNLYLPIFLPKTSPGYPQNV
jgi:hypothetical protein